MQLSIILALLLVAATGCSKSSTDTPPSVADSKSAQADALLATQLAELTQAVRRFGLEQRKAPTDLGELVAQKYIPRLPVAPAGKRFSIGKNLEVTLVNQ